MFPRREDLGISKQFLYSTLFPTVLKCMWYPHPSVTLEATRILVPLTRDTHPALAPGSDNLKEVKSGCAFPLSLFLSQSVEEGFSRGPKGTSY